MNRRKMLVTSLVIGAMGLVPLFAQAQGKGHSITHNSDSID